MQRIEVDLSTQTLTLFNGADALKRYVVSTAANGAGEREGSECTPRGLHRIAAKIGGALPVGAALQGRSYTGDVCDAELYAAQPNRDWILSRVLWLEGAEAGLNRGNNSAGENVDSMRRYIYIHGTPDAEPMGVPQSHGCIRMRNNDVIALYQQVQPGTPVNIKEK